MMEKIQRFGGAMFTPVLLFTFAGIMVSLTSLFLNPLIVGDLATKGTLWFSGWTLISDGAWTVFNQMELLFVIGLPIGLTNKASARAAMEALITYLTFNYFVSSVLEQFGSVFGVNFATEVGGQSGLKMIAGIKTLDTGVLGAIVISAIVVWLHNRYFEKSLPEYLGVFQGSAFVVIIGFFSMIPIALLIAWFWPKFQIGISSAQVFLASSGNLGVWLYIFLEKILLPTGLHHFVYAPFQFGPAIVEGGTTLYWVQHLREFASSPQSLKALFPEGGFALQGLSNIFGIPGIAMAFYATARPENRKKALAILIPAAFTAVVAGITEPFDYTFLFIAPALFAVHAVLAATMATTMYVFGVVGDMGGGLIDLISKNWLPLGAVHWPTYVAQIIIGFVFMAIYFLVFRFLILKFRFQTPGREPASKDIELHTKKDFKEKKNKGNGKDKMSDGDRYAKAAEIYLNALGGYENIFSVTSCATRLRVGVIDPDKLKEDDYFKSAKAHGVVRNGKAIQIIVGLSVTQIREKFEDLLNDKRIH